MRNLTRAVVTLVVPALLLATIPAWAAAGNWSGFRGNAALGVADGHPIPAAWDVDSGKNVRWKTAIPGLGHSSPVIWGDRLFVTSAISGKKNPKLRVGLYGEIGSVKDKTPHKYMVYALDKNTGEILWSRLAYEGVPAVERHTKATHANCTPATDGEHLVAFFGSEGLYAYDMDGKLLWKKNFGTLKSNFFRAPEAEWGFASSPVIHDGKVLVQVDVAENSFVAALDVKSGKELWRTPRHDVPTWSTPTVHVDDKRGQLILNGWKEMAGYNLADGKQLWKMHGTGDIPTPTPFVVDDLIIVTQAHGGGMPVYAIKTSATGDITLEDDATSNEHVAWSAPRGGSYQPTAVAYDGLLYILRDNGVLRVRNVTDGELIYEERVAGSGGFTASLVAGDGKIYLTEETGTIFVVKAGREYELLATNENGEVCMASPAISEGMLYYRMQEHLMAIGTQKKKVGESD